MEDQEKLAIKGEEGIVKAGTELERSSHVNRVLVFGSTGSGAFDLQKSLQERLEETGIENPSVIVVRDVALIEDSIYDKEWPFPEDRPTRDRSAKLTLPRGVVILPEMRQYPGGKGMTVYTFESKDFDGNTPFDFIKGLCEKNGIPYMQIREKVTPEQLDRKVEELFPAPKSLNPGE